MRIGSLIRPGLLFALPLMLSAAAWAVPGESMFLRGFAQRSDVGFGAVILLLSWYVAVFLIFKAGTHVGGSVSVSRSIDSVEAMPEYERNLLRILTLLASVGVLYALFLAQQQGSVLTALAETSGNDLSEPLRGGTGLATARYTTVVATPFAFVLWLRGRIGLPIVAWNSCLLLISSLFSSRMSLVMALVVFAYIYARLNPDRKFKTYQAILVGSCVFLVLGALNYFRNARYYVSFAVDNPILMNIYQILTYLGTPFQVAGGVSNSIFSGTFPLRGDFSESLQILVPTFFQDKNSGSVVASESRYANQVDVAGSLTTNSAFADIYNSLGPWGLIWSLIPVFVAGVVYGHCRQYRSGLLLAAGVALYLLAEYWRIFLFNQGIVIYLFIAVVSASILSAHITRRRADNCELTRPSL